MYQIVERDGGYDLLERFRPEVEPIKLGHYDTKPEAETSLAKWKVRDKIIDRIDIFIDSNIAEFGEILDGDEIRQMISEHAK